jgi:hypothetical protein
MAWPNLFVVGAAKAGTTLLWRSLAAHPDVYMSALKEPHYFSGFKPPSRHPTVDSEAAYLALFDPGSGRRYRGEASPSYLWHADAPAKIARRSPEARIVISLRDPVERTHSAYLMNARLGAEPEPFEAVVARELDPSFVPAPERVGYVRSGLYADGVQRYLELFPGRVLVLLFDDLIREPEGQLLRVWEFLGVDPAQAPAPDLRGRNHFVAPRNGLAAGLFGSARARRVGRAIVPPPLRVLLERMLVHEAQKPEMDATARRRLEAFCRADARHLGELLGVDLPWPWLESTAEPQSTAPAM